MDSNEMFMLLSQFHWPEQDEVSPLQFVHPSISSDAHPAKQSIDHNSLCPEESIYHRPEAMLNSNELAHDVFPPPYPSQSGTASSSPRQTSQRNKYCHLDWDAQHETLKRLYLTENKTLSETMRLMKDSYGFNASMKLYKDRFRQWNWSKNLPTDVAGFMATKLKRRQQSGLETIFTYGEREWDKDRIESTLRRNIGTPEGVTCCTPPPFPIGNAELPPSRNSTIEEPVMEDRNTELPSADQPPLLSWNGMTRTDVLRLQESSRAAAANGQVKAAIRMLLRALEGMRHLSGVIQEVSNSIAYELATLYFQEGSQREADAVLDEITRLHFQKLGSQHKRTRKHILASVELLDSWDRHDDALGLLAHSDEILQYHGGVQQPNPYRAETDTHSDPSLVSDLVSDDSPSLRNDANIDQSPSIPHHDVDANNEAIGKLLLRIIQYCKRSPHHLNIRYLQGYRDLMGLYRKMGDIDSHQNIFQLAAAATSTVLDLYLRYEQPPESS
ncbi:unnamed protein product [Clonostachys solani]|uniref:Clr5 domain-containing protein n=1 Tax=Clonostachys solani TaxID=160281 RepID=A0A9N9Z1K6_9HYPO|nr:unnamed protein product [Clonostachys solani]